MGDQLATLLRHYGHEVRLERTGEGGIAAVALFKPEVVLLDIGLPDLDGHEVARRIRRVTGFEHVAIIGLSGYPSDERNARAPDSPFDEYLTKPVLPGVVKEAMARQTAKSAAAGAHDRTAMSLRTQGSNVAFGVLRRECSRCSPRPLARAI